MINKLAIILLPVTTPYIIKNSETNIGAFLHLPQIVLTQSNNADVILMTRQGSKSIKQESE